MWDLGSTPSCGRKPHRRNRGTGLVQAEGPGAGGGVAAQFVDAGGHALAGSRLDAPELQLGLARAGFGIRGVALVPPPLPVDDPVLEDRADGAQPASPDEPERPAVRTGLNLDRLAVHPVHAVPPSARHEVLITWAAREAGRPACRCREEED